MVRTLSQLLKAELVGYHRNFRIASANVRTDSGRAGVIGSPPRHEDSSILRRGRGTYLPPVIEGHEGHPRSARAQWSGVIRAANLAFIYTCPLYLRVIPPVLTGAEPAPEPGNPWPRARPAEGSRTGRSPARPSPDVSPDPEYLRCSLY